MDENKVCISLEKYIEMYDNSKKLENYISQIGSLILNATELTGNKKDLKIDSYDLKSGRILDLIKELFPNEYEIRFKSLLEEEE